MPEWAYFIFPEGIFHFPSRENFIGYWGNHFPQYPAGKAPGRVPTIDQYILNNRKRKREGYPSWLKNNLAHAIYEIGENLTNLTVISYLHLI